jgi:hypothetical protein
MGARDDAITPRGDAGTVELTPALREPSAASAAQIAELRRDFAGADLAEVPESYEASRMRSTLAALAEPDRQHFHACAFVNGLDEERAVIDPFFVEGMLRGEKAVYIVDPKQREAHQARLAESAPSADLLDVTTWNEAHLRGGSFDQDRMMSSLDDSIREHAATGRPPMRIVGQMGWVFSSPPGIDQLIAYEASVNEVLNRGKTPTICVFDVRRLSGSMMMDLLRAHPLTVMNGVLHENPFYTPADEMLRDLERRRASA